MNGLSIQTNSGAASANMHTQRTSRALNKSVSRLSSGLRVQNAGDDAAALAVSEKMRAQSRSISKAMQNANDAVTVLQVAESGYQSTSDLIVRMRELAVGAANGSLSDSERGLLDQEFQELLLEVDRVAEVAEYNGIPLMTGGAGALTFQIGFRNSVAGDDQLSVTFNDQRSDALLINAESIGTQTDAQDAINALDLAMESLHSDRADIGAKVNTLNAAISSLTTTSVSYKESIGTVRDADIGAESTEFARHQVMQQAGIAMIAQSNTIAQNALRLLNG
jgi:flagellin